MKSQADHFVIGVHITDRVKNVPAVQNVLTDYGCSIKTRIGLHEVSDDYCSPSGLLLVEVIGSNERRQEFLQALLAVEGVDAQSMVFVHD